jgi:hypothetical protein
MNMTTDIRKCVEAVVDYFSLPSASLRKNVLSVPSMDLGRGLQVWETETCILYYVWCICGGEY